MNPDSTTENITLTCQRCDHTWTYTGTNDYRTTCPHCGTTVSVQKQRRADDAD